MRLLAQAHDPLAQRREPVFEALVARTLELQQVLELTDARRQARILFGKSGRGDGHVAWFNRHHATSGGGSAAGASFASASGTANSRRGWGSRGVPQRGHSSRDR